jgi:hypothetical protein
MARGARGGREKCRTGLINGTGHRTPSLDLGIPDSGMVPLDAFSGKVSGGKPVTVLSETVGCQDQVQNDTQQKQTRQACQEKDREKPHAHLMNPPC